MGKAVKFMAILALAAQAVWWAQAAYSQEKTGQEPLNSVSAEIVSVNPAGPELVIKIVQDIGGKTVYWNQILKLSPKTKILKAGTAVKLADLKAGDKIEVKYTVDNSRRWKAESIDLQS